MSDPYCSEISRATGEGLAGTADVVHVWLLLEYRGHWGAQVLADNTLDAATRGWLDALVETERAGGKKVRLQFIKQQTAGDLRLYTVKDGQSRMRSAPDYAALRLAVDVPEPNRLYFVCTHGQRDRCCADFGLPLYRALRDRLGDRVFQTSHLGGHRFAPNVLVTPDAVMYGRVSPADVDDFLGCTEAGAMATTFARGRTCHVPAAQAAEILAGEHSAVRSVQAEADACWSVVFASRTVRLRAEESRGIASCGDDRQKTVVTYNLV